MVLPQQIKGLRRLKHVSQLKRKIRGLFLWIMLVYIVLSIVLFFALMGNFVTKAMTQNSKSTVQGIGDSITSHLMSLNSLSRLLMTNRSVLNYLNAPHGEDPFLTRSALNNLYDIGHTFDGIYSVFLIRNDGGYITTGRDITRINQTVVNSPAWRQELDRRAGRYEVRLNGGGAFTMNTEKDILSFLRRVYDLDTQKPVGYIAINLPASMLTDACRQGDNGNAAYGFLDLQGNYFGDPDSEQEFRAAAEGEGFRQTMFSHIWGKRVLTVYPIAQGSLGIAMMQDLYFTEALPVGAVWIWIVLIGFTVVALVAISSFISKNITTPIEKLCASMAQAKEGRFKRVSLRLPNDEIAMLKDSYNEMLVEINRLIEEVLEKEQTVRQAEMDVLREQIKPHFLYNTLETICFLSLENPREEIYDAVETLGNFYRKFLNSGGSDIPLGEEIAIVRDYLKLQKLRYGDIFEDVYEIEPTCLDVIVPKLILQPLVENSLYHGIRLKGEKGLIKISVFWENGMVFLKVYDTGVGMTPQHLRELLEGGHGNSFGLKGTMDRMMYAYQRKDMFRLESREGVYFQVTIKIPGKGEKIVPGYDH